MNTFLFIEQSPNPLAVKFVFKDPFLSSEALVFDRDFHQNEELWLRPFWNLSYLQQIYIAQNFIVFIHKPTEKKLDSHLSLWADKTHELQNLLSFIPFPLSKQNIKNYHKNIDLQLIQEWLDKYIKKATWIHGGAFQVVKIENQILYLRPDGACYQCPYLGMTVYKGILEPLNQQFPQIQNIQLTYDFF